MPNTYRKGPIGALMDEYERAALDLRRLVEQIPEEEFVRVVDAETADENCRSVQTIMSHVVNAGYGYADYIRKWFAIASARPPRREFSFQEILGQFDEMLAYTAVTLEGRWELSEDEIMSAAIKVHWGPTYDLEQLLEHAIVHILRHRRQVDKFISQGAIKLQPA